MTQKESYQQERQIIMSEENITRRSLSKKTHGSTDWAAVKAMSCDAIDYSDSPATTESFWDDDAFYVRLDAQTANWLKSRGLAPQQYVNELLHQQMQQPR